MKNNIPISSLLHYKPAVIWSIEPGATVYAAIKLMADKNIGAVLVLAGEKLTGIFTERDYTRKIALQGKSSKETRVSEVFSGDLISVGLNHSVEECMKLMTEHRVRHLPVLDGDKVVGLVSIGDLVNWTISTQDAEIAQLEQYIAGGATA